MSKRNFILLIIVLVIVVIGVIGFLSFHQSTNTTPPTSGTGTNFIANFNPFGKSKTNPPVIKPPVDVSGYQPAPQTLTPQAKLIKVSTIPVAGFTVFSKERLKDVPVVTPPPVVTKKKPAPPLTEFAPALRYVGKATGNIYQTFVDKIEERKFSGTVIPKVYDAYFGNNGQSVVMRYLKPDDQTIETFVGVIPKEVLGGDATGVNEIKGSFLPDNIKDISVSLDNSKIFYLFNTGNSMVGAILNFLSSKKSQILSSTFTEWLSQWPNDKMITLTTKPSGVVPGYMYSMDGTGKNLIEVLGNINGLTTLASPNGKLILYGNANLSLNVYHSDKGTSAPLQIKTLPEKCIWGKAGDTIYCAIPKSTDLVVYPDAWYQGGISFNDQIWKVDIKTGNGSLLLDPAATPGGEEVDGIKLALDANENYLFFVNKKDSFLWEFRLK